MNSKIIAWFLGISAFGSIGWILMYVDITARQVYEDDPRNLRQMWKEAMELSIGRERERVHRLPDVIGIGIQKCGTEAMMRFLDFHPYMRVMPNEARFFVKRGRNKGGDLNDYREMLPSALEHELVMEKTPAYFRAAPNDLPQIMHKVMPNLKLVLILCNPVQRALSSFAMEQEFHRYAPESFDDFVHREVTNVTKVHPIIRGGIYHLLVRRWMREFEDSLLIVDGKQLLEKPWIVIEEIQRFLDIPVLLREHDFKRDETSGMFCVWPWWEKRGSESVSLRCLPRNKGRTRSSVPKYTMSDKTERILKRFYQPHNEMLFEILGKSFDW